MDTFVSPMENSRSAKKKRSLRSNVHPHAGAGYSIKTMRGGCTSDSLLL
jgi:hypothetical protein